MADTVKMVSPAGNPEVISMADVDAKLAEGYRTQEAWHTEAVAKAEQKFQEWCADPATAPRRFELLRENRNLRLTKYDAAIAQLEREARLGAVVTQQIAAWDAYAQALCALPAQPGAPWDGGGSQTPWPVAPEA